LTNSVRDNSSGLLRASVPSADASKKKGDIGRKKGTSYKTASPLHRSPSDSPSNLAELDPELDSLRIVDVEHGDGGSADGGSPDKDESRPFEVALPAGAI
jgi:hypothetical protein